MKRVLLVVALLGAAAAALPGRAAAADECRGLMVCIPVAGPWVVVPSPTPRERTATVAYELRCPRNSVVGGLDARVSDRAIDVAFLAATGSPVSPGVTTTRAAVFVATYAGSARRTTTFRPFIGCIPTSGGGGRSTTVLNAFRPGKPIVRRVRTLRVRFGLTAAASQGCSAGERLVSASHAVAFRTPEQPSPAWLASVRSTRAERAGRVTVRASRDDVLPPAVRVEVQIHALCAKARP